VSSRGVRRWAVVLALVVPAVAFAERPLALEEALSLARQNNPSLDSARARVDLSRATVKQAWAALLPQIGAQGRYTHNWREIALSLPSAPGMPATPPIVIQPQEQLDLGMSLNVPLVVPAAYPTLKAQKHGLQSAERELDTATVSVLFGVAQTFFAAAGTDELLVARRHAVEVAKKTLDDARARLGAGAATKVDLSRAEIALVRAEVAVDQAEDVQFQTYRALGTLIGLQAPFHVTPGPIAAEGAADLVAEGLAARPEIAALERTIESTDGQILAAKLRWAPTLSGFGNARVFNYSGFAGQNYAWGLGLQLDWAIFDGGLRDVQRDLARAQRRDALARLKLAKLNVADEVVNAQRTLKTRTRTLAAATRTADLAKETLRLVRVQLDNGSATQLDLLQAQDSLVAAEVGVAQSRFEMAVAALSLERAAGRFAR
jgi:outer membrane protein TolC